MTEIPERVRKRFWSRVAVRSEAECWPFRLSVGSHGYGQIGWQEEDHNVMVLAHRVAWELTVGPIPDGLTIDHLCRNQRCCNPSHLRLLTHQANCANNGQSIRTHCPQGHPYDHINTYVSPRGDRRCRICEDARRGRGSSARSAS